MAGLRESNYRGGFPHWVARILDRCGTAVFARGIAPDHLVTLKVRLEEVAPELRAPVLTAYLKRVPTARVHVRLRTGGPLSEFERIAPRFPVFRVLPRVMRAHTSSRSVDEGISETATPRGPSPLAFFALVFVLSVPFLLVSAATGTQLLPGLPVSSLAFVCPATAAAILVFRENGAGGMRGLFKRSFDHGRIGAKAWYVPILLMPAATASSYVLMRLVEARLSSPEFPPPTAVAAMFVAFLVGALGEELGWSGYATEPMQDRWGALGGGILLGLVWAAWHLVPLAQVGRSLSWIAPWCLYTVALRVLTVWIYNNAGKSVFATALFHATSNLSWQLFPNSGSHWDPRIAGPILACAAAVVAVRWGPRTLTRHDPLEAEWALS